MSLQGKFISADGVTHTAAYAKVCDIHIDYFNQRADIAVFIFHDAATKISKKRQVGSQMFNYEGAEFTQIFNPTANIVQAIYDNIKITTFSGWTDV